MTYPIAPAQGYLRTATATEASRGKAYPHDAFGVDTGGRVRPHSGFDATPTVKAASQLAVVALFITRVGFTVYAGYFIEGVDSWGRRWLHIHLASRPTLDVGAIVPEGTVLGIVGNTGGSGALGASKIGVHSHTSVGLDASAIDRIIYGLVRARFKGETSEQWAAAHALVDPWPIIRDAKAIAPITEKPTTSAPSEEDIVAGAVEQIMGGIGGVLKAIDDAATETILIGRKSTGAIVVANIAGGVWWHVENMAWLGYVRGLPGIVSDPDDEPIWLPDDQFRAYGELVIAGKSWTPETIRVITG